MEPINVRDRRRRSRSGRRGNVALGNLRALLRLDLDEGRGEKPRGRDAERADEAVAIDLGDLNLSVRLSAPSTEFRTELDQSRRPLGETQPPEEARVGNDGAVLVIGDDAPWIRVPSGEAGEALHRTISRR